MTRDEINVKIETCEAELAMVRSDIINGPQGEEATGLKTRRGELEVELAALKAMLEEA